MLPQKENKWWSQWHHANLKLPPFSWGRSQLTRIQRIHQTQAPKNQDYQETHGRHVEQDLSLQGTIPQDLPNLAPQAHADPSHKAKLLLNGNLQLHNSTTKNTLKLKLVLQAHADLSRTKLNCCWMVIYSFTTQPQRTIWNLCCNEESFIQVQWELVVVHLPAGQQLASWSIFITIVLFLLLHSTDIFSSQRLSLVLKGKKCGLTVRAQHLPGKNT
jgi:hypothetical protein